MITSLILLFNPRLDHQRSDVAFENVSSTHLPSIVLSSHNSMDAEVVDIDMDGDLDMVIAVEFYKNVILLNDGTGKFEDGSHLIPDKEIKKEVLPYRYYPYHDSEDVAVEDFDHDGDYDIVIVTEDDQKNEHYVWTGNKYVDKSDEFPVTGVTNGLTAADLNGDGGMDLVLANNGQDEILMNVKGTFIEETSSRYPESDDITQDIEAADVDGDGDLDLIVGNENLSKLLLNHGNGSFSDETTIRFKGVEIRETREVDAADVDGDGDLDLFLSNVLLFQKHEPIQQLLINDGKGFFTDETSSRMNVETETGFVDSDFNDLDMDGDLDLIMGGFGGLKIMENDGSGHFKDVTLTLVKEEIKSIIIDVEMADFDQDGKNDIYLSVFRGPDIYLKGN
ncbi:MAG: VCBS repeat-containing protein [Saprospiraceae bacterium]|nr:VCBS repeat-containing protein [Saprospiraceae bacterium]